MNHVQLLSDTLTIILQEKKSSKRFSTSCNNFFSSFLLAENTKYIKNQTRAMLLTLFPEKKVRKNSREKNPFNNNFMILPFFLPKECGKKRKINCV